MIQSRRMSLLESATNTVIGFIVSVIAQGLILPLFGIQATFAQDVGIVACFTVVSIIRSYLLRRFFESLKA